MNSFTLLVKNAGAYPCQLRLLCTKNLRYNLIPLKILIHHSCTYAVNHGG